MIEFSYNLVMFVKKHSDIIPSAVIIACANMLLQNFVNLVYGSKGLPKLRGYRGE